MADPLQAVLFERIQGILAKEFGIPPAVITPASRLGHDPWWDSLGHLQILLVLAEECGFRLTADLARRLTSISKIAAFLDGNQTLESE